MSSCCCCEREWKERFLPGNPGPAPIMSFSPYCPYHWMESREALKGEIDGPLQSEISR